MVRVTHIPRPRPDKRGIIQFKIMRIEDKLLGLREEILTKKSEQTPIEQFQNTTIRPILKYQHSIIIVFFNSNVHLQYIVNYL